MAKNHKQEFPTVRYGLDNQRPLLPLKTELVRDEKYDECCNWRAIILRILLIVSLFAGTMRLSAQGTAFTYQGMLNADGIPANGSYDLTFQLFNVLTNGVGLEPVVTNTAAIVSNGLFTMNLDFGMGIFTGSNYWVEISVRTNGGGAFTKLIPRSPLTPSPYAIYASNAGAAASANSVSASNITGAIPLTQLAAAVVTNNANNVILGGTFNATGGNVATNWTFPTTNGTAAFQAAFTSGMVVLIAPDTYYVTNLFAGDNTTIMGQGLVHLIMPLSANVTGYMVQVPPNLTNFHISGVTFNGQIFNNPGGTLPSPMPINNQFWNYVKDSSGSQSAPPMARSGIKCNMNGNNSYSDIVCEGFNVAGFYLYNTNGGNSFALPHCINFSHNQAYYCYVGLHMPNENVNDFDVNNNYYFFQDNNWSAEYSTIDGFIAVSNTVGIIPAAGNHLVLGAHCEYNFFGLALEGGVNPAHGVVSGSTFNHQDNAALHLYQSPFAEEFIGCNFYVNGEYTPATHPNIDIYACSNTVFTGCSFSDMNLTATNNGLISFDSSDLIQDSTPPIINTDGTGLVTNWTFFWQTNNQQLVYKGGTVSATNFVGNGAGLTNLGVNNIVGGVTSNIVIGGHTFYYTNGVLMNIQ